MRLYLTFPASSKASSDSGSESSTYFSDGPCTGTYILTLTPLMWRIWWAPNNASKWQMGFNSAFKGLRRMWFLTLKASQKRWVIEQFGYHIWVQQRQVSPIFFTGKKLMLTSDKRSVAETSTWQHTKPTTDILTAIPVCERPHNHALDRATTGISSLQCINLGNTNSAYFHVLIKLLRNFFFLVTNQLNAQILVL